jgi:hypothetical protein
MPVAVRVTRLHAAVPLVVTIVLGAVILTENGTVQVKQVVQVQCAFPANTRVGNVQVQVLALYEHVPVNVQSTMVRPLLAVGEPAIAAIVQPADEQDMLAVMETELPVGAPQI